MPKLVGVQKITLNYKIKLLCKSCNYDVDVSNNFWVSKIQKVLVFANICKFCSLILQGCGSRSAFEHKLDSDSMTFVDPDLYLESGSQILAQGEIK
jgi:hypothetical protein